MLYSDYYSIIADYLGVSTITAIILLSIIAIWSLVWKGLALWKSAHKEQAVWFIVLLVVNTIGILEILYIFIFSEMKFESRKSKSNSKKRLRKR